MKPFFGNVMHVAIIAAGAAIIFTGCSGDRADEASPRTSTPNTTSQTAIEGATGKTAVKAGQKARDQINRINSERNEDIRTLDSFSGQGSDTTP